MGFGSLPTSFCGEKARRAARRGDEGLTPTWGSEHLSDILQGSHSYLLIPKSLPISPLLQRSSVSGFAYPPERVGGHHDNVNELLNVKSGASQAEIASFKCPFISEMLLV